MLQEVEELGRTIASAKTEIAALRVDDITGHDIPFATDELDAIVAHTARRPTRSWKAAKRWTRSRQHGRR